MPDVDNTQEKQETLDRVNEMLQRFGRERDLSLPALDDRGSANIQRGSAVVSIQVHHEQGVLLVLSRLFSVPDGSNEDLFRRLLELSMVATSDAAFAINKGSNEIFLRCLRGLEGMDYNEFEDIVHTVATVADEWDDKLRKEFPST